MGNLLENVIKIQAGDIIPEGSKEYKRIKEDSEKVRAKFDISKDLRRNISYLHLYQLNGLCSIDWNAWLSLNKNQTKQINEDAKVYIKTIRELNPEIVSMIDEALGIKPHSSKISQTKSQDLYF